MELKENGKKNYKQLILEEKEKPYKDKYEIKEDIINIETKPSGKYKEEREYYSKSKIKDNEFSQEYYLDKELFIVNIKKNKSSLFITCEPKDEVVSIYNYSIDISYEEFLKLGKSFKLCDNIDEVFTLIKNIINQLKISTNGNDYDNSYIRNMKAYSEIKYFENDSIKLYFKIPLLNGKYEEIDIKFKKEQKDILGQLNKIKEKYLKIKSIVYSKWTKSDTEKINEIKQEFEKK